MFDTDDLLQGAYDLHVHPAPDIAVRRYNDIELAKRYRSIGLRGFVIKTHQFQSAARAQLVNSIVPGIQAIGSITLNCSVGGLNPVAVEIAAQLGARIVWFPTVHAKNEFDVIARTGQEKAYGSGTKAVSHIRPIEILHEGKLVPEVDDVLSVIKQYDLILATGHIAPEETLAVLKRAKEMGIRKMIATHVTFSTTRAGVELQQKYIQYGAYLEHTCYTGISAGQLDYGKIFQEIRTVGPEHVIFSTDLGQANTPDPADALSDLVHRMHDDAGFSEEEIHRMIQNNPEHLLGIR
jgi:predicted TIM-barrel fold metal-dependent hydrolase